MIKWTVLHMLNTIYSMHDCMSMYVKIKLILAPGIKVKIFMFNSVVILIKNVKPVGTFWDSKKYYRQKPKFQG